MTKVRVPVVAYEAGADLDAAADSDQARLFANGRSQAVRLPKAYRMPGNAVRIHREGRRVVLEPLDEPERDANGWPRDLWTWLDGETADFPDLESMPVRLLRSDEIEALDEAPAVRPRKRR